MKTETKYRPVAECFELTDKIRASHLLFDDFKDERTDIQKFVFYTWLMDNKMGAKVGKDENGDMGYSLKYISNTPQRVKQTT